MTTVLNSEYICALMDLAHEKDIIFIEELIALLDVTVPPSFNIMHEALKNFDLKSLTFEAHRLKGCGGNISANSIYEKCNTLQSIDTLIDREQIVALIESVRSDFDRARQELMTLAEARRKFRYAQYSKAS